MGDRILLGVGRWMIPIPAPLWKRALAGEAARVRSRTGSLSPDHRRVRDLAVLELARTGAPLAPRTIATKLDLPLPQVTRLLDEMEARLTYLFRNSAGEVTWAYPVTVDRTPHRAIFAGGEEAYSP